MNYYQGNFKRSPTSGYLRKVSVVVSNPGGEFIEIQSLAAPETGWVFDNVLVATTTLLFKS
jgi:hypothetical protein